MANLAFKAFTQHCPIIVVNPLSADVKIKFLSAHAEAVLESPDLYKGEATRTKKRFVGIRSGFFTLYATFQ